MSRASSHANATVLTLRPRGAREAVAPPRKKHVCLTGHARQRLADQLAALDMPGKADYRRLAQQYSVSLRTVEGIAGDLRRDSAARNTDTGRMLQHAMPAHTIEVIAATRNTKEAWRQMTAAGEYTGSYPTFARRINGVFGKNVVLGATRGISGMDRMVREKLTRRPFMHAFTIDLFSLRAHVVDGRDVVRPMGMFVREDHSGLLLNIHLFDTDAVTAEMVASVIGQAIRGRTVSLGGENGAADVFLGGLPDLILCDNASNFLAADLNDALAGLGIRVLNTNSYSSHENGAHERVHGTLRSQLLRQFPTSSDGPTDDAGRLLDTRAPLALTDARALLAAWARRHNTEVDTHGTSPLQRYRDADPDQRLIRHADPSELATLALRYPQTCKRYAPGVLMLNEHYVTPALTRVSAKRFEVRRWLGDDDHVELFTADGTSWIGTATRNGAHTAAESQALTASRADEKQQVRRAIQRGTQHSTHALEQQLADLRTNAQIAEPAPSETTGPATPDGDELVTPGQVTDDEQADAASNASASSDEPNAAPSLDAARRGTPEQTHSHIDDLLAALERNPDEQDEEL